MSINSFWNERYADDEFAYGTLPNQFYREHIDKLDSGKILFVCEGEGRNAVYAAKQNWIVEAFDLSEEGKKKAMILANQNNVFINYKIADAANIDYTKETFDVVVLVYAHFPESIRKTIHQKVINWLRPKGLVIMEAFSPNQLNNSSGGPKDPTMLYTKQMIQDDFSELSVVQLSEEKIHLEEGKYHSGVADVIRFIGMRLPTI